MPHPFDLTCENHPERPGTLAVDLPSIGVRRFLCEECNLALRASLNGGARIKWNSWAPLEYQAENSIDGRSIYADHQGKYRKTDSERTDV